MHTAPGSNDNKVNFPLLQSDQQYSRVATLWQDELKETTFTLFLSECYLESKYKIEMCHFYVLKDTIMPPL